MTTPRIRSVELDREQQKAIFTAGRAALGMHPDPDRWQKVTEVVPRYEWVIRDLHPQAFAYLLKALRTGELVKACREKGRPIRWTPFLSQSMQSSSGAREEVAVAILATAEQEFRRINFGATRTGQTHRSQYDFDRPERGKPASLSTYFIGMCQLVAAEAIKAWEKANKPTETTLLAELWHAQEGSTEPSHLIEVRAQLREVLKEMSDDERRILSGVYSGKTYVEIGDEMRLSSAAVAERLRRLRRRLRRLVKTGRLAVTPDVRARMSLPPESRA